MPAKSFIYRFADAEVTEREFSLVKAGQTIAVEPKAFRVLLILLRNPKKLLPKEELLSAVWGDAAVTENSLTRAIALLRRVLGDDAREPRFIETVTAVGYRWICPVEQREDPAAFSSASDSPPAEEPAAVPVAPAPATGPALPTTRTRPWARIGIPLAIAAILLAVAIWYLTRPLPPPRITAYTQITHDGRFKTVGGTDGSRVYFTLSSPSSIAQVSVTGGESAPIPSTLSVIQVQLMDISPDGSNALVGAFEENGSAPGQWVVPILGGAPKHLEDGGGETFSPDGGSVIYSTLTGDIFMAHIDGSLRKKLASLGSFGFGFRWSPDGKVIRFSKADGLWEMSADGSGVHRLLSGWKEGLPCCGQWTRDGALFLFGADGQLWALDERRSLFRPPSSVPIQLSSGPIRWDGPVPGRDGKTIFVDGAALRGELARIDLKTGSSQPFLGGISAEYVSFSPDGRSVAYVTFPEGVLWRVDRDGGNRMQLSRPPDYAANPRWSPDGKEIVFTTETPDGRDSIHRVSALDGSPLWLLPEESAEMHDANWSPDGRKVLFAKSHAAGFVAGPRDLRIVDLQTRQVSVLAASEGMWSPRWSPDGRYIVAMLGATSDLHLFDLATRQWRNLPPEGDSEFPSFSRDSRFVYFLRFGPHQGIFRIPVAGGKAERVLDMADWHLTGNLGFSMSLDPTDAPLVLRDTGSTDIYALTLKYK